MPIGGNLDSSLNIMFSPHVQVPAHVLPTPVQTGLTVKDIHGRPPGSPIKTAYIYAYIYWYISRIYPGLSVQQVVRHIVLQI